VTSSADRILLIQDRRIGDVVLSTALLEDLAAAYPSAAIDFLVGAAAAPVLRGHPLIHETVVLRRGNVLRMWREIRARRYDIVIDVQGNGRTAMITRASGARARVGWDVRGRGWLYSHRVPRERELRYVVHDRQRLLHAVGIPTQAQLPKLYLSEEEREAGESMLKAAGATGGRVRVALVLVTRGSAKNWPIANFAALSSALLRGGRAAVLLPGPGEEAAVTAFHAAGGTAHVAPPTDIRTSMALIAGCSVFLSADTGPAHIATALGVPRVTLYGPTSPRAWDPGVPTAVSLRSEEVSCAGCRLDRCVHANACMMELSPARVMGAIEALILPTDVEARRK
jgi:lipopolysaccharide heptosyltransferase II